MRLSSPADYANLLGKYDTWMFDCDGVLWQGDKLIDGAVDALNLLRRMSMYSCVVEGLLLSLIHSVTARKESPLRNQQLHQIQEDIQGQV